MTITKVQSAQFSAILASEWSSIDPSNQMIDIRTTISDIYREANEKAEVLKLNTLSEKITPKIGDLDPEKQTKIQEIVAKAFSAAASVVDFQFEHASETTWFLSKELADSTMTESEKADLLQEASLSTLNDELCPILKRMFNNSPELTWRVFANGYCNNLEQLARNDKTKIPALREAIHQFSQRLEARLPKAEAPKTTAAVVARIAPQNWDRKGFLNKFKNALIASAPSAAQEDIRSRMKDANQLRSSDASAFSQILGMFSASISKRENDTQEKSICSFLTKLTSYNASLENSDPAQKESAIRETIRILNEISPGNADNISSFCNVQLKYAPSSPSETQYSFAEESESLKITFERTMLDINKEALKEEAKLKFINRVIIKFEQSLLNNSDKKSIEAHFRQQMEELRKEDTVLYGDIVDTSILLLESLLYSKN